MDGRSLPRRSKMLGLVSALAIALTGIVVPSAQAADPSSISAVESASGIGGSGATTPAGAEVQSELVEPTEPTAPASGSVSITLNVNADVDPDLTGTIRLIPADWDAGATGNETIVSTNFDATAAASPITVDDVPAGTYVIEVKGNKIKTAYSGGAASPDLARVMTVAAGQTTTADAIVVERLPMGSIELPIKVPSWNESELVSILLFNSEIEVAKKVQIHKPVTSRVVVFSGLPPGKYTAAVSGQEFQDIFTGNTKSINNAEKIEVFDNTTSSFTEVVVPSATTTISNSVPPKITGTPKVGSGISIDSGSWSTHGITYYTWYADGKVINEGTVGFLEISSDLEGKVIHAKVTVRDFGYLGSSEFTPKSAPVAPYKVNLALPSISGTPQVGQTLTTDTGVWADPVSNMKLKWLSDGRPIEGETSRSIVLAPDHAGTKISVEVKVSDWQGKFSTTRISSESATVLPHKTNTEPPTISGSLTVGSSLSATTGSWLLPTPTFEYQWQADGQTITGATSSKLELTADQVGKKITVTVTAHKTGYTSSTATSEPTTTITAGSIQNTTKPTITGTTRVNEKLTVHPGDWSAPSPEFEYQWLADGSPISGETQSSITLTTSEYMKRISVRVSASKSGYISTTIESAATQSIDDAFHYCSVRPSISGTAEVGERLVATTGVWDEPGLSHEFHWFTDDGVLEQEKGNSLVLSASEIGKTISVTVYGSKYGYYPVPCDSDPTVKVGAGTFEIETEPKIEGEAQVGQVLSVSTGTWTLGGLQYNYQWFADGVEVEGETSDSLAVPSSVVGKALSATVTATKAGYEPVSSTSRATANVKKGTFDNTVKPVISGYSRVDEKLYATSGYWSLPDLDYSYQWFAGANAIEGATTDTYHLTPAEFGTTITVAVTASKIGYSNTESVSHATSAVAPGSFRNTGRPTVNGDLHVGSTLTAEPGEWSLPGITFAYQWKADDDLIAGANQPEYVLTDAHLGQYLSVIVTATKHGYTALPVESSTTGLVGEGSFKNLEVPLITGTPKVGTELSATIGQWSVEGLEFSIQWLANGSPIPDATNTTFTPTASELGAAISIEVTASKHAFNSTSARSEATTVVASGSILNTKLPTISGGARVGNALEASVGSWSIREPDLSYQWYADGIAIAGAESDRHILNVSQVGSAITVAVSAAKDGYIRTTAKSLPTVQVTLGEITNTTRPAVTGEPQVGRTLRTTTGVWSAAAPNTDIQWLADGAPIDGASSSTLNLGADLLGKRISVLVNASMEGYESRTAQSHLSPPVEAGVFASTSSPTISGTAQVGQLLSFEGESWSVGGLSVSYQWNADTQPIAGATGKTFTPTLAQVGKSITVTIIATKAGYKSVEVVSKPTQPTAREEIINHEPPIVFGNLWVGALLEFENDYWSPSGLTYTYQWLADGVAIPGATNRALKLTSAQLGKRISVAVTASKEGAESLTVTSKLTREAVGAQPVVENTVDPAVSGTARVGSKLTAKVGAWAQDNLTYTYKWYADGKAISGATSKTFTLTSAQLGKSIKAKVTAHKPDWASGSATTKSTAKVVAGTIKDTSKATISGTTRVGSTLTAKVGTWSTTGLKYSYKWYANGTTITGATSSTLKLSSSHRGKAITVKVTASKAGYTSASSTSAATAKIGYGIIGNSVKPTVTGSAKVGSKLTAKVGTWSPSSLTYTYQWLANGKTIKGATKSTYTIPAGSVGKKFSVTVKAAKSGYTSKSVTSAQTKATIRSTATASGKLSTTSIKRSSSAKIAVTVKAPGVSKPTGTVYVKVGTKTVKATLKSTHAGKITVTLKGSSLSVGSKQKVTVSFTPDSATGKNVYKSAAKSAGTLTVKK